MAQRMPGDFCIICGNYRKDNPWLSFHRFPTDITNRSLWVRVFELDPEAMKSHHKSLFSVIFNGNPLQSHIGRRFVSPIK